MAKMRNCVFALMVLALSVLQSPLYAQSTAGVVAGTMSAASDPNVSAENLSLLLLPLTAGELEELAGIWQGHLRDVLEKNVQLNLRLRTADEASSEQIRQQIVDATEAQGVTVSNYREVLTAWRSKGAAPESVEPHDQYIVALAAGLVKTTDPRALFTLAKDWVFSRDGGLGLLIQVGFFLLAIGVLVFVSRFVRKLARNALDRTKSLSRLLRAFILRVVFWVTFAVGFMVLLAFFGINVTPLFAVFGGLSFILGFALQETLGNLASGLMIMVLKPFDTGDYIQVGGSSGVVDEMSVVSTKIRTFDNQIIVVPNSKIWGDVITNVSASEERRVDLVFGIAYSDNAAQAIKVLTGLVEAHSLCLAEPPAEIFVGELGDSSVNLFCRPWCKSDDYWTVYWDLTGQAKEAFDAEGISIPFPQRDVHLIQESSA